METQGGTVQGTCLFMCPVAEREMREREGLLHLLECESSGREIKTGALRRPWSSNRPRADPRRVVKLFSRPAAGRSDAEPSHLRPASVLRETVTYLFQCVVSLEEPAWTTVYEFVFDRLRAVRQDMVVQGIVGRDAIVLLEQVVRFHLYASYRLRDADTRDFDPVINKQHLLECLKRLLYLYKVTPGTHPEREVFEAVYLLDNIGDTHALSHYLELDTTIRQSRLVSQCYDISQSYVLRNYSRALRVAGHLKCAMCLCALNPNMLNIRVNYLQILNAGFSSRNCKYPLHTLMLQLGLHSQHKTEELCSQCRLVDRFDCPQPGTQWICFNKAVFCRPSDNKKPSNLQHLDNILGESPLSGLLLGPKPAGVPQSKVCCDSENVLPAHDVDRAFDHEVHQSKVCCDSENVLPAHDVDRAFDHGVRRSKGHMSVQVHTQGLSKASMQEVKRLPEDGNQHAYNKLKLVKDALQSKDKISVNTSQSTGINTTSSTRTAAGVNVDSLKSSTMLGVNGVTSPARHGRGRGRGRRRNDLLNR